MSAPGKDTTVDDGLDDDEMECCGECLEEFHYDDCGGYNPPCPCGSGLCRPCCDHIRHSDALDEDRDPDEEPEDDDATA